MPTPATSAATALDNPGTLGLGLPVDGFGGLSSAPPFPLDPGEFARVEHQRLRRRMLYGGWGGDAKRRMLQGVGPERSEAWGRPDISRNVFRSTARALSALYDRLPKPGNTGDIAAGLDMRATLKAAGLYPLMQRYQRDTWGMRNMFLAVTATMERGHLRFGFRPVWPDLVEPMADPENPGRPIRVLEWRPRRSPTNGSQVVWTADDWDISDPANPVYRVLDSNRRDASEVYGLPPGGRRGDLYLPRRADNSPVLPYVLHHAEVTGTLLDPFQGIELVEGTLEVACFWAYYRHILYNSAYQRPYGIGVEVEGATLTGDGTAAARHATVMDPSVFTKFRRNADFDGQPIVGALPQSVDPKAVADSIVVYMQQLASEAGVPNADLTKQSGDPRSGYAVAISMEGKREAQLRYQPVYELADIEVLELCAVLANRAAGAPIYPEDGWTIEYTPVDAPADGTIPRAAPTPEPITK